MQGHFRTILQPRDSPQINDHNISVHNRIYTL